MASKVLWLIIGLGLLVRIIMAVSYPIGNDEGHFLYDSWLMGQGLTPFKDYESRALPLIILLYPITSTHSLILGRLVSVLAATATAYLVYLMGSKFSEKIGLLAAAIFYLSPYTAYNTVQVMNTPLQTFFSSAGILLLMSGFSIMGGILIAFGSLSTEIGLYFLPLAALIIPLVYPRRDITGKVFGLMSGFATVYLMAIVIYSPSLILNSSGSKQFSDGFMFILSPEIYGWLSAAYLMLSRYPFICFIPAAYALSLIQKKFDLHIPLLLLAVASSLIIVGASEYRNDIAGIITSNLEINHRGAARIPEIIPRVAAVSLAGTLSLLAFLHFKNPIRLEKSHLPYLLWLIVGAGVMLIFPKWHTYYPLALAPAISVLSAIALSRSRGMLTAATMLLLFSWLMASTYAYTNPLEISSVNRVILGLKTVEGEILAPPLYGYMSGKRIALDISHPLHILDYDSLLKILDEDPPKVMIVDPYMEYAYEKEFMDEAYKRYYLQKEIDNVKIYAPSI